MDEQAYLKTVLSDNKKLFDRIVAATEQQPDLLQSFVDLAKHLTTPSKSDNGDSNNIASKKRKLDVQNETSIAEHKIPNHLLDTSRQLLTLPGVSFTIPVRKKLPVYILGNENLSDDEAGLRFGDEELVHFCSFKSIEQVFCLPVPEKSTAAHNFVILAIPEGGGPSSTESQFIFSLPETAYVGDSKHARPGDNQVSLLGRMLNIGLQKYGKQVILPTEDEFKSAVPAGRKNEIPYHVKAHLGSKDGYLFFLPNGIFYGFRKPASFYAFEAISSISYTSILQRTFNLVISLTNSDDGEQSNTPEVEFSMLDQADFAGIDAYIKRHGLNDASMAHERQAKKLNVNGSRKVKDETADVNMEEEEATELEKAEKQIQDEEDEQEEDYDPSENGDGSESSSGEEEEEEDAES